MAAGPLDSPDNLRPPESALAAAARFLRRRRLLVAGISAILLTPCFWQRRIQAGDLASHVYNAWLVQLIEHGQAPGLWIARQWNNVLFDFMLSSLGNRFGLPAAERIAVSFAVLVFFWGAFALACAAARRAAWPVVPVLAMVAYGWTFQMGFFNYYLSLGFAFFALALLWRGRGWERAWALAFVPLIWLAHPLGLVLAVCAGAWIVVAGCVSLRGQLLAAVAAVAALVSVRLYIMGNYQVFRSPEPRDFFNGADQLLLFGPRYRLPLGILLAVVLAVAVAEVVRRRKVAERRNSLLVAAQLYGLAFLTVVLLPETIGLPEYAAPAGFLRERLSCICAIFACCVLASMQVSKRHLAGFMMAAAVFFSFLYMDTARLNRLEDGAGRIERSLPAGQRVLATIPPPSGSRIFIFHIVDRSCIGHCFSYGNYEPGSEQFRVRASPGNRFVTTSFQASVEAQRGEYTVQAQDLPIFQISPCKAGLTELCMRPLAAGEINGR